MIIINISDRMYSYIITYDKKIHPRVSIIKCQKKFRNGDVPEFFITFVLLMIMR